VEIIDLRVRKPATSSSETKFDPRNLEKFGLKKIILLPDFSPGKSYLPVGTVALFDKDSHMASPRFIGRDIGCGMSLFETNLDITDIDMQSLVDKTDLELTKNSDLEFTLGNHFLDFCKAKDGLLYFVLHAGYKKYGMYIVENDFTGSAYIKAVEKNIKLASSNRNRIAKVVYEVLGIDRLPPLIDKAHNTVHLTKEGYLYRKGATNISTGELSILPSNLLHPIFIIKGKSKIQNIENSFSHGTLRKTTNNNAEKLGVNFQDLRNSITMPRRLTDQDLEKLLPTQYEDFFSYAHNFSEYISIEKQFEIIGYLGFKHTSQILV
jgi:hypothetical protein